MCACVCVRARCCIVQVLCVCQYACVCARARATRYTPAHPSLTLPTLLVPCVRSSKEAKSNVTVEEGRVYYEGHAANATLLRDGNAANASAGDFSQFVKHGPPAPPPPPPRRKVPPTPNHQPSTP